MSERIDTVRLLVAPQNFEVLQQRDGVASVFISGELGVCTRIAYPEHRYLSHDALYAKVICESDGALAVAPAKLEVADNRFSVKIENIPIGGPYTVDFVCLSRERCVEYSLRGDKINHLFVGDVYLIAGQSNAAGMGRGMLTEEPEIGISVLRNLERWDIASSPMVDDTRHNMFLAFAKKIRRETGMPIGLIPAAVGGAPLSTWLPSERGEFYTRAMEAMGGKKIRGVLWYQGCSDAGDGYSTEEYLRRFTEFVNTLRADLSEPDLPFFTFQLNRQMRTDINPELGRLYDGIREAQRLAAHKIDGGYVLPAIDSLNMSDFIHNSRPSNVMLGERMARQALNKIYGCGMNADAPEILSARLDGGCVVAEFSGVTEYLSALNARLGEYPLGVTDADGEVELSDVRISANKVYLTLSRDIKAPAYLFGECGVDPDNIMIDYGTGLPILCFCDFPIDIG
jgi:hypothetical protein